MAEEIKKPVGRPRFELTDERKKLILEYARNGFTMIEIANMLETSHDTLELRLKENEDFSVSVKAQKEIADNKVINILLEKAKEGDIRALEFWLKNRQPDKFNGPNKVQHSGEIGGGFILRLEEGKPREDEGDNT